MWRPEKIMLNDSDIGTDTDTLASFCFCNVPTRRDWQIQSLNSWILGGHAVDLPCRPRAPDLSWAVGQWCVNSWLVGSWLIQAFRKLANPMPVLKSIDGPPQFDDAGSLASKREIHLPRIFGVSNLPLQRFRPNHPAAEACWEPSACAST